MSSTKQRRTRDGLRNGKRVRIDIDTDEIVEVLGNAPSSFYDSPSHNYSSPSSSDSDAGGSCD